MRDQGCELKHQQGQKQNMHSKLDDIEGKMRGAMSDNCHCDSLDGVDLCHQRRRMRCLL